LLADSVEAATRTLKDPIPKKIEEVVRKIINNKFIDGQLDECDLTLKDLEKISSVFIRILSGIYHSRVNYPEEQRSEDNHKKFPKENSHQSQKDKTSNP
jgi:membrane-associated HD superfamily phosphohydrolase